MLDLSASDTQVYITFDDKSKVSILSEDFAFEGNPITIAAMPVAKMEIDLNGHPVVTRQRTPIRLTLSLIPGSDSDEKMQQKLYAFRSPSSESSNVISEMYVSYPTATKITFRNGCVMDGIPGVGLRSEGRVGHGGVYNFEFADYAFSSNGKTNSYTLSPSDKNPRRSR